MITDQFVLLAVQLNELIKRIHLPIYLVELLVRSLYIETANTADAADTVAIDLANYGGSTFLGYIGNKHTTDDSVIVTENPTTAVSGTTVTLTIPAGTDNDKRVIVLFYS